MTIKELVSQLTLQEKAKLAGGADAWHTAAIERLGIPAITVSDGPHGLRKVAESGDVADLSQSRQAVCFPAGVCLASTFNRDLAEHVGELLGDECLAEDVDILLGPAINIKRSPLCGRNFEYLSEDPYVAGQISSAYIRGVQSKGVGVSLKHFAANNQEKRRMTVSAVVDERTLREIYLAAFEEAVKTAHPDTLMCSYNRINGVYSSENPWLLNKVLRDEWGFDGFVMSDWGAVNDRPAGVEAGLDLEMPTSSGISEAQIIDAVEEGRLKEEYLDKAVEHILNKVNRYTGFMDIKNGMAPAEKNRPVFDYVADHKEARKVAREGMVLLKNDGALPLKKDQKILFIGEFAKKPRYQGGGSSHINPTRVISALSASTRHTLVEYTKGFSATKDIVEDDLIDEAVDKAAAADVAVIFAGLPDSFESEGYDREHMRLPQCQNRLIREVAKVQPNTVVVLHNGSPVSMPWIGNVNAVLEAYLAGEASGEAVIDILFGVVNPSGKLAESFPISIKDTPCYDNFPGNRLTVEYREGLFVGYRYYDRVDMNVLFPFGHGLSYTTFAYSGLEIKSGDKCATVSFKVKNTGKVAGAEVAQIYVGKTGSKVFRPLRELKGFEKVFLAPGEEKEITVELNERAFSYYCVGAHKWCVEPGAYTISVGSSSRDIRLRGDVWFNHEEYDIWQYTREELPTYYFGDPSSVSDSEFEKLLCGPIPESVRRADDPFTLNSTIEDARSTKWGARVIKLIELAEKSKGVVKKEGSGMFIAMINEMPFHSVACMSGGKITIDMAEAIVSLLNNEDVGRNLKLLGLSGVDSVVSKLGGKDGIKSRLSGMAGHFKETASKAKEDIAKLKEKRAQAMAEDEEEDEEE
ncbi:MAG: glycoside hydrolase family 3 C-terminal domain-containing protein [Lachnospiraceae bacterium]|nr:glycoside hydrolase family 3 C-terminal domain-containing protein [Lachnospiraceae bacterium]